MLPIDWATLSRLVPEVALVVIFMLYTRDRDRAYLAAQEMRDAEWRGFLREERAAREKGQEGERTSRAELLKEERQARSDATARLGEEMKGMGQSLAATQALLIQHDAYTRIVSAELTSRKVGGQ